MMKKLILLFAMIFVVASYGQGYKKPTDKSVYTISDTIPIDVWRDVTIADGDGGFSIYEELGRSEFYISKESSLLFAPWVDINTGNNQSRLTMEENISTILDSPYGFTLKLGSGGVANNPSVGQVLSASNTFGDLEWSNDKTIADSDLTIPTSTTRYVNFAASDSELVFQHTNTWLELYEAEMYLTSDVISLIGVDASDNGIATINLSGASGLSIDSKKGISFRISQGGSPLGSNTIGESLVATSTNGDTEWGIQSAHISSTTAPTPTSTGTKGQIIINGLYMYTCIATDTWVRSAIETTW